MDLGNKIIKLRKKEKLSQEALSDKLGVTRQTISNWELNITKPDILQIKKLSEVFNISIDELLDNNLRDIIEKKITNTEKLTNKTTKNLRIIIITLYFIILTSIITFTVCLLSNNDFTDEYQLEIYCTLDEEEYYITIDATTNESDIYENYTLIVSELSEDSTGYNYTEKYAAGNTFTGAIDSIKYVKEILLDRGATCK